jgi:hypothetical protein
VRLYYFAIDGWFTVYDMNKHIGKHCRLILLCGLETTQKNRPPVFAVLKNGEQISLLSEKLCFIGSIINVGVNRESGMLQHFFREKIVEHR